jgi:N-acetylmuramoyl-L-alanine amidase
MGGGIAVKRIGIGLLVAVFAALLYPEAGVARNANVPRHHATARHAHTSAKAAPHHAATTTRQHAANTHQKAVALHPRPAQPDNRPLVVIDAGHGGQDPGAIGVSGTMEKTITLATAKELRRTLEATGRYRVALTRTGDRTVSLAERLAFARRHDADLLIAIHADASRDHNARGASVYISSRDVTTHLPASQGNAHLIARALAEPEPSSAWLQYSMIDQLDDDVRMTGAPARHAHLYVLGSRTIPSVLLETGFLSNRQDEALLRQAAHRHVLVRAVSDAIDDYFAAIRDPSSRT